MGMWTRLTCAKIALAILLHSIDKSALALSSALLADLDRQERFGTLYGFTNRLGGTGGLESAKALLACTHGLDGLGRVEGFA